MPQRSPGPLATTRTAAWLLALCCALGVGPSRAGASHWVVQAGQSASEVAQDQVPSGTSIDQFLLAIYLRNPQAFAGGDIDRLLAQTRLSLPSADESNAVPADQAREQLARLRAGQTLHSPPSPPAAAPAPEPAAHAPERLPAPIPAPSPGTAPPSAASAWLAWVALAVVLLGAWGGWNRRRRSVVQAASPPPIDQEARAQGRFQPVLPGSPEAAQPRARAQTHAQDAAPAGKDRPAGPATAQGARPALFDLDLSLDGQAPPLDLSLPRASPGAAPPRAPQPPKTPDLTREATPAARASGPLDLRGISLDLDPPAPKGRT